MKKHILIFIVCAVLSTMLVAQTKKTIALLEFEGAGGQDGITLADLFATELTTKNVFTVLTRTSVDEIMAEHKFQRSPVTDIESVKAIGNLVNADYIIVGKISTLGDSELLTVQMISVATGQVEVGESMPFEKIIETLPSIETMIDDIAGRTFDTDADADTDTAAYKIGDIGQGGGLIFYVEGDGYLEASETLGRTNWSKAKQMGESYQGGDYDDWYLPSKDELNYIYENLAEKGFIEAAGWLWSSSEYDTNSAWAQGFSTGSQYNGTKTFSNTVRAVRAFIPPTL